MTGFSVDFVSPVDFNHIAAEICFDGRDCLSGRSASAPDEVIEVAFFSECREPLNPVTRPFGELLALLNEIGSEVAAFEPGTML